MNFFIHVATHVYEENMYINKNYSKPDSTLNKKNNAVFYHAVRVSVAM